MCVHTGGAPTSYDLFGIFKWIFLRRRTVWIETLERHPTINSGRSASVCDIVFFPLDLLWSTRVTLHSLHFLTYTSYPVFLVAIGYLLLQLPPASKIFIGKGKEFGLFCQCSTILAFAHAAVVSFFSDFKIVAICVVNNDDRERI